MTNNFRWVAYLDFKDGAPEITSTMILGAITFVGGVVALCYSPTPWDFLLLIPVLLGAVIGLLMLTNSWWKLGDRSDKAYALYEYFDLPGEIKSQLPKMDYKTINGFSPQEAKAYKNNIRSLQGAYDKQQEILKQPRHQQHLDETKLLIEQYEEVNKQLN